MLTTSFVEWPRTMSMTCKRLGRPLRKRSFFDRREWNRGGSSRNFKIAPVSITPFAGVEPLITTFGYCRGVFHKLAKV